MTIKILNHAQKVFPAGNVRSALHAWGGVQITVYTLITGIVNLIATLKKRDAGLANMSIRLAPNSTAGSANKNPVKTWASTIALQIARTRKAAKQIAIVQRTIPLIAMDDAGSVRARSAEILALKLTLNA
jgi:hypothetical protein